MNKPGQHPINRKFIASRKSKEENSQSKQGQKFIGEKGNLNFRATLMKTILGCELNNFPTCRELKQNGNRSH